MKRSMAFRRILILVIVALAAGAAVVAHLRAVRDDTDASALVSKALLAENRGNYVADICTTARYAGEAVTSKATVHRDGRSERIQYNQAGQDGVWTLTTDRTTYTYLPRENRLLVGKSSALLADKQRVRLLLENYRARIEGGETVAGRAAYVVSLSPRRASGPSKRLWIDAERYTVLKSVDYSASGKPRAEMEVASVSYNAEIDRTRFELPEDDGLERVDVTAPRDRRQLSQELGISVQEPSYVPKGFVIEGSYLFNCPCGCNHRSAQLTYTDGLNTISVFQTPAGVTCSSTACRQSGHDCIIQESEMARLGQINRADKSVAVVADLLPDEVRKIAESVQ